MNSISAILRKSRSSSALRSLNARNRASYSRGRSLRMSNIRGKTRRTYYALPKYGRRTARPYNRRKLKNSYTRYYKKRRYMRERGLTYSDPKVKLLKQGSESWLQYYKDQHVSAEVFNNLVCWASWRTPRKIVDGIACLVAGRPYVKFISLSDDDKEICTKLYAILSCRIAEKRALLMTPGYYQASQIQAQASREIIREHVREAVRNRVEDELRSIKHHAVDLKSSDSYKALQKALTLGGLAKRSHAAADGVNEDANHSSMHVDELS